MISLLRVLLFCLIFILIPAGFGNGAVCTPGSITCGTFEHFSSPIIPSRWEPTQWRKERPKCNTKAPNSRDGSFSPDGKEILFASTRNGDSDIYKMNLDGTNVRLLIRTPEADHYPFYSPDGRRIIFDSYGVKTAKIYVSDAEGNNIKLLTDKDGFNADPNISPDGKRIAFYSGRDGVDQIYVMNIDGTDQRRITKTTTRETTPVWSPDGKKILFVSTRDGNAELYVMNPDGSDQVRLTSNPLSDRVARWSPNGKQIVFYSRKTGVSAEESWASAEIEVINADGSDRRKLTDDAFPDMGPVFSPDGKRILFTSCRTGNREIYIMDSVGGVAIRLTFSKSRLNL